VGLGENMMRWRDLSGAHRVARLGMGDIMSLIERAEQAVDKGRDGDGTEAAKNESRWRISAISSSKCARWAAGASR